MLVGMKMVQPLWKTHWCFLKKLKIELPCDSAALRLGRGPRELKTGVHIKGVQECSIVPLYITAKKKKWKQFKYPSADEWMNKAHSMEHDLAV